MRRLSIPLAALLLFGCSDDPVNGPRELEPARVALSTAFSESAGGTVEAYTQSNTLWLRFSRSSAVVIEQTFAFDGTAAEVRVPIEVPLRETTESLLLQLELRRAADPIFRGTAPVQLTAGRTAEIELTLQPVVHTVNCTGPEVVLDAINATAQLQAVALFVTGDTIPNPTFTWSATGATAVTVGATTGLVTARADGTATVTCAAAGVTSTRAVRVFAVVTAVAVAPPTATIQVGASQAFTATARDRLNNIITGRTVTWTAARPAVASLTTTGTATGLTADTTRITATVGTASGTALLTVVFPPPVVTTTVAANVTGTAARASGTVNPRGAPTSAYFEYGTSPTLATSTATPAQDVGNGSAAVTVNADLANLTPATVYYFRTVATSAGGTTRGTIVSFTTLSLPTVTTTGAVVGGGTRALLSGTANPNGQATTMWFEYGTSPTLATFATSLTRAIGSGTTPVAMDTSVTGLTPGTQYYFRAAASSAGGTARGAILSFTTESGPIVTTLAATQVSGNSAVMRGTINPNGTRTASYWFEYGTSPTLATFTATTANGVGSGTSAIPFNETVDVLAPGTTYYFRAVGQNAVATTRAAILSFTTLPLAAPTAITRSAYFPPDVDGIRQFPIAEGVFNANGLETEIYFEFSVEDSTLRTDYYATGGNECVDSGVCQIYGEDAPDLIAAGNWNDVPFSDGIFDAPCSPYLGTWVRAVAVNAMGTARGNIFFLPQRSCQQFNTIPRGGTR